MRKNVCLCVTGVACVLFVSVALFSLWVFRDSLRVSSLGQTEYSERLQVNGTTASADTVAGALEALSDAYGVSIMKVVTTLDEEGSPETVYTGAFSWDTFPVDQLCLLSGSVPSDQTGYLASWDTGDPAQSGLMYSFASSSHVSVRPLGADGTGLSGADGIYLVTSSRAFDSDAVNRALSQLFGLSVEDLLSVRTTQVSAPSAVSYAAVGIAVLSGCAYLLFVVTAPVSDAKRIGVCKMLGWSGGAVWASVAVPVVVSQAGMAALVDLLLLLLASPVGLDFVAVLVGAQALVVLLTQAMGAAALLVIRRIPVVSMLENGVSLRVPLVASVSLKLLVAAGIVAVMVGMSGTFDDVVEQCRSVALWNREGGSYYVFASSALTDEQLSSASSGDTRYDDKFASLWGLLNDAYDGRYVSASTSVPLEGSQVGYRNLTTGTSGSTDPAAAARGTSREWTEMDVNVNYLDEIGLTDEGGSPLRLDETESRRILLLPSTMPEEDRETVLSRVAYLLDTLHQAEAIRWGEAGKTWDESFDVLVYLGGTQLFSFSRDVGASTGYLVEDPYFLVLTEANVTNMEKSSLALTGTGARMLLPIDEREASDLQSWLAANGFADDRIELAPLSDAFSDQTALMLSSMGLVAEILALVLAFDAGTSWLLSSLLVLARGRRYAVERLLGWGWSVRHGRELLGVGMVALLAMAAMLVTGCGTVAVVAGVVCLGLDALVFLMVLRRFESRGVLALVKGA